MYRGKRPTTPKLAKARAKEINHKGKAEVFITQVTPPPPTRPLQISKTLARAEKELHASEMHVHPHAGFKKVSKRTTPGKVPSTSTPAHVNPEGKRWIRNLQKQERGKALAMTKRLNKRR